MIYIIFIGISFALFTSVFFATKKPAKAAHFIASAFMIFFIMQLSSKLFMLGFHWFPLFLTPYFRCAAFTFGPFLYLYASAETGHSIRRWYLHFIPYAVVIAGAATLPDVIFGPPPCCIPGHCIHIPQSQQSPQNLIAHYLFPTLLFISMISYTVLIRIRLHNYRKRMPDFFSSESAKNSFKWLKWTAQAFFLSYAFVLGTDFLPAWILSDRFFDHSLAPDFATTFFIIVFTFFAVKQPVLFSSPEEEDEAPDADDAGSASYSRSGLKNAEAEQHLASLEQYMQSEKPYLNPDISISDIAAKLNIPRHHITQVLNERLGKNFYNWINEYRIQEVLSAMDEEKNKEHSIIRIAYDSGFNSKSTFNTMFKKMLGVTPSEYRAAKSAAADDRD